MQRLLLVSTLLIGSLLLSSCGAVSERLAARREAAAAKRAAMPAAETICVAFDGVDIQGAGMPFLRRKIASQLAGKGFRHVDSGCDATVRYTAFNHGQWELIGQGLFGTKSRSAWRTEGVLELSQANKLMAQDRRVDIRDSKTMQDMLTELAEEMSDAVSEHFRPTTPQTQPRPM